MLSTFGTARDSGGGEECFPAGTKILLADFSEKNIEDITEHDIILSYDTQRQKLVATRATAIWSGLHSELFTINGMIDVTAEHPFWTKEKGWASINPSETKEKHGWKPQTLEIGDHLMTFEGKYIEIVSIDDNFGVVMTYNFLNVLDYNTYFANSILVHNKGETSGETGGDGGSGTGTTTSPTAEAEAAISSGTQSVHNGVPGTETDKNGVSVATGDESEQAAADTTAQNPASAPEVANNPFSSSVYADDTPSTQPTTEIGIGGISKDTSGANRPILEDTYININEDGSIDTGALSTSTPDTQHTSVYGLDVNSQDTYTTGSDIYPISADTNTLITLDASRTSVIIPPNSPIIGMNYLGESVFVLDENGNLIYAKIVSEADNNYIEIEGIGINLNFAGYAEIKKLPSGLFNITLSSHNGTIFDPNLRTECITLSRTSRYIHLGIEKLSVYIPNHGSDFSLCLRTQDEQNFERSCDSCGYLDFIDTKAELKGIFYYETHNQLIPYPPYFPDRAIESDKTSNIFTGDGDNSFFENLHLTKSDTTGKISSLYSANFRVFEQDDLVCAELNPYQMDHITTKYLTSYLSEPITIHANMLTQKSQQNTLRMFETDSEISF